MQRAEVEAFILEALRAQPEGLSKQALIERHGSASPPTMQRAISALKDEGIIARDSLRNVWKLEQADVYRPLDAPALGDLQAVLVAEAMLGSLADDELRARLRSLAEQLDARIRERPGERAPSVRSPVEVTVTSATRVDGSVLQALMAAVRDRTAVRLEYTSPWTGASRQRAVEPWGLRLHDAAWYLRAYDRKHETPRTYRLAHIEAVTSPGLGPPIATRPPQAKLWSGGDPAFGIDNDRPDRARVVLQGPLARWVEPVMWSPNQRDRWVDADTLERVLDYASCREFARVVRSVVDAVVEIEPAALREEVFGPLEGSPARVTEGAP